MTPLTAAERADLDRREKARCQLGELGAAICRAQDAPTIRCLQRDLARLLERCGWLRDTAAATGCIEAARAKLRELDPPQTAGLDAWPQEQTREH